MELLKAGWDCNVYRESERIVYKDYDQNCLGMSHEGMNEKRRNPAEFLLQLASPIAERVISTTDTGFYTDLLTESLGSFSKVDLRVIYKYGVDKLAVFIQELEYLLISGVRHNDIHPDQIFYNSELGRFVLVDWTHVHAAPNMQQCFLNDDWALCRLKRLYDVVAHSKSLCYWPWFCDVGTMPLYWLAGNLSRWLLCVDKTERFWPNVQLCIDLLDATGKETNQIINMIEAHNSPQSKIIADSLRKVTNSLFFNWYIYGDWAIADTIRRGFAAHVFIPGQSDRITIDNEELRKRMNLFLKALPIEPDWSDYI